MNTAAVPIKVDVRYNQSVGAVETRDRRPLLAVKSLGDLFRALGTVCEMIGGADPGEVGSHVVQLEVELLGQA